MGDLSRPKKSLPDLAAGINAEHRQCEESLKAGLLHARAAGLLLIEAKAQLPHGKWTAWLEENCEATDRTARTYMTIAANWNEILEKAAEGQTERLGKRKRASVLDSAQAGAVDGLSVRGALKLLTHTPEDVLTFSCPTCGEKTDREVWHCPGCNAHLSPDVTACGECDLSRPAPAARAPSLLEMLLPRPLAVYLAAGAITEEHVRQLLTLRDIYGPDLQEDTLNINMTAEPVGVPPYNQVEAVIDGCKPEDHPQAWYLRYPQFGSTSPLAVVEAARAFVADVTRRAGKVPQWEVAAFWWASQAVLVPLKADDSRPYGLGWLLSQWQERYETALVWLAVRSDSSDEHNEDEDGEKIDLRREEYLEEEDEDGNKGDPRMWWGYHADLRWSGSLERARSLAKEPGWMELFKKVNSRDYYSLPTNVLEEKLRRAAKEEPAA